MRRSGVRCAVMVCMVVCCVSVASARTFEHASNTPQTTTRQLLKDQTMLNNPLAAAKAGTEAKAAAAVRAAAAARAAAGTNGKATGVQGTNSPVAAAGLPLLPLGGLLNKIQAALPPLESLNFPGLPEQTNQVSKSATVNGEKFSIIVNSPSNPESTGSSTTAARPAAPLLSSATAVGLAFNGGKASAKASAHTQGTGDSSAQSDATALADRTAISLANAASNAGNPGKQGLAVAQSSATSVGDKSSLVISEGGSRSVGLGGNMTWSATTTNSAATDNSLSYVGGTSVSSAVGAGSNSATTSHATGAAENHATSATRADSISVGANGSNAQGIASAGSQAANKGTAASQALMESFAIVNGDTTASSTANATASGLGLSLTRDKAVAIGLQGATANTTTASGGATAQLGLSVIDSVARAITGGNQSVCAKAVTKTFSDLATGPQLSLDTFILTLNQRADEQCVSSFKDLIAKAAAAAGAGSSSAGAVSKPQQVLPTFERINVTVSQRAQGALHAARAATDRVHSFVAAAPEAVPSMVQQATWGAVAGK